MARPRVDTRDLLRWVDHELDKKVNGYTKAQIIARTLVNACCAKDPDTGVISESGTGTFDQKAVSFLMQMKHGKPVENRKNQIDVFHHYPQLEQSIDVTEYKITDAQLSEAEDGKLAVP